MKQSPGSSSSSPTKHAVCLWHVCYRISHDVVIVTALAVLGAITKLCRGVVANTWMGMCQLNHEPSYSVCDSGYIGNSESHHKRLLLGLRGGAWRYRRGRLGASGREASYVAVANVPLGIDAMLMFSSFGIALFTSFGNRFNETLCYFACAGHPRS